MRAAAVATAYAVALSMPRAARGQQAERFDGGRFTVIAYNADAGMARSLLAAAQANDTFPGLPRPVQHVVIALAQDAAQFRQLTGPAFPEWGAAAAFPASQRIVMHGHSAAAEAGNPLEVLRHELAHLALGEFLGDLPPRWFDEGYASFAAGEWGREEVLATNLALVLRGPATFASLDDAFIGGTSRASGAYALAYRAVAELAGMDPQRGLSVFFKNWRTDRSLDAAVRQSYGMTLDGFEARWRSRTRRRYGLVALGADVALLAALLAVLVLPVYIGRRQHERRRLETLRIREIEQVQRARESALDALFNGEKSDQNPGLLDTSHDQL